MCIYHVSLEINMYLEFSFTVGIKNRTKGISLLSQFQRFCLKNDRFLDCKRFANAVDW